MRHQIIITAILSVALSIALFIRLNYVKELSGHTAYYFLTIFWICGVLIVIFVLNIAWHLLHGHASRNTQPTMAWTNRRKTYRIIYPNYKRPILFVERADNQTKRRLEYPVLDLSQNGLCFLDDGSLGAIHALEGRIQFQNGETISIHGSVLRNHKDQVSVELDHDIGWSVILDEQRRLLSDTKPIH